MRGLTSIFAKTSSGSGSKGRGSFVLLWRAGVPHLHPLLFVHKGKVHKSHPKMFVQQSAHQEEQWPVA